MGQDHEVKPVRCSKCGGEPPLATLITVNDGAGGFRFECEVETFCASRIAAKPKPDTDPLEAGYWLFDTLRGKQGPDTLRKVAPDLPGPMSERDAFKRAAAELVGEALAIDPPAEVAELKRTIARLKADLCDRDANVVDLQAQLAKSAGGDLFRLGQIGQRMLQEILVRKHPTGVRPLMCPACYGVMPKADHAHPETYDDAIEACRLRGVEPTFLAHPLEAYDVDLRDVGPCFDGVHRSTWEMLGTLDPDATSSAPTCDRVRLARAVPVTDPDHDAPDGAVVDDRERVGDRWEPRGEVRCGANAAWVADVPADAKAYARHLCDRCFSEAAGTEITCEPVRVGSEHGPRVGLAAAITWKKIGAS